MAKASGNIEVFIESGSRRVFASALDWPRWARRAKTEELALDALADYLPRYAEIVRLAGLTPPSGPMVVVERHAGLAKNADFGALGEMPTRRAGRCWLSRGEAGRAAGGRMDRV
jgi:hypothetical protein